MGKFVGRNFRSIGHSISGTSLLFFFSATSVPAQDADTPGIHPAVESSLFRAVFNRLNLHGSRLPLVKIVDAKWKGPVTLSGYLSGQLLQKIQNHRNRPVSSKASWGAAKKE